MDKISKYNRLIDEGFSLITVGESKVPNYSWKNSQSKQLTKKEFEKRFNYKGGYFKKDSLEMPATKNVGIVTGFDYLEVIDIDLKVFSTAKEQKEFWDVFTSYLEDSIFDFKEKFLIVKTINSGFHLIYKSKRVESCRKISRLKGHKEAVIETKGIGGYVFVYDKFLNNKTYSDVKFITDEDRSILFDICDSFDYKEEVIEKIPVKKQVKKDFDQDLKPWEDYNDKNNVIDIISDEFKIVRILKDRTVVKRNNAESAHSGYIFNDNGCLFLHSTSCYPYPERKQISAFDAYTLKNHNGNYSESTKAVYEDGYGDRLTVAPPKVIEKITYGKEDIKDIDFPLEVFPEPFQRYIMDCYNTLDSSIDYMGCSLLWSLSVICGNSFEIEVKKNWIEKPILWLALVGKAGIGKTPSIYNMIRPLEKENSSEIYRYFKQLEKFEHFDSLSDNEKKTAEEVKRPPKTQFIVNDITVEALIQMHQENKNAIGVFKDELAGWFKDMNKYREGSDLEMWLSSWSGKMISLNRVTKSSNAFLPNPFMPVLGGIQPSILNNLYTEENKENGFMDRVLLSFPELSVDKYNDNEMDSKVIEWYENTITNFYRKVKNTARIDDKENIESAKFALSREAKIEWGRIFNKISEKQNSDSENEYMKSMLPKQKSYIPRFSLLLHILRIHMEIEPDGNEISKDSFLLAEKLSDYFVNMSKKIKVNAVEVSGMKKIIKNESLSIEQKVTSLFKQDPKFNKTEAGVLLGVSRQTIHNIISKLK